MRKYSKGLTIILLLMSLVLPILSTVVVAETDGVEDLFTVGTAGPRSIANWDMTSYIVSTGDYYRGSALEPLYANPYNATGRAEDFEPVLATSWTFESRPNEMTAAGFMAYDGVKSMEFTLRQNVTFHDGSNWNATVCKWNIDRMMYQLGNIDNCLANATSLTGVTTTRAIYWMKQDDWDDYATASWNVTDPSLYGPAAYGYPAYYPGFGYSSDRPRYFPRFTHVTVTEDLASGGKVNISFNDWASGPSYLLNLRFISMDAYKDYWAEPIQGYGGHVAFPQGNTAVFPGHLIGTGPYIFEEHDAAASAGTMLRNNNWWNATAQQAQGWHTLERVVLNTYSHDDTGYSSRNLAMTTGDIDWAFDRSWEPLDPDQMKAASGITYHDMGVEDYGENVVLNCVNETYLRYWDAINLNVSTASPPYQAYPAFASGLLEADDTIIAHGINRAFRKALSYAFDYDTFIGVVSNNRVERSGGFLCTTHPSYNPSINLPVLNLTIARQALIDDPIWGARVAARHLDITNSTAEWNAIAASNPIYTMEYNWDAAHLGVRDLMTTALENIGCDIDLTEDTPSTYGAMTNGLYNWDWLTTDGFSIKWYYRRINEIGYLQAYYGSTGVIEHSLYGYKISDWKYYTYLTPLSQFPYVGFSNAGFNFNVTCDKLLYKLWFDNSTGIKDTYDELTDWMQNFQYCMIYLGQDKIGHAISNDWDYAWRWETFRYNLVKPGPGGEAPIPGFSIGIVLSASLIALLGIAYTIMRKNKRM